MNRDDLIKCSIFYDGDYNKIKNAFVNNEIIESNKIVDNAITILDENYPANFLQLKDPPFVLYYKGNLELLKRDCIAVVGSRMACEYALQATKGLVMNNNDKVIVSGLAKGIDAMAHRYASKTIGILGCGIDYKYPYCNYDLIKKVEKEGLLLSEYPFLSKPYPYRFPFRNRLIAALASKIYIMQSKLNSGTMTTINQGLELGREIKVLPYSIFDENGINNNNLIYEGADLILKNEIAF